MQSNDEIVFYPFRIVPGPRLYGTFYNFHPAHFCKFLTLWSCSEVPPSAALWLQHAACRQGSSVSFFSSLPKHTSVGTTCTGGFRRKRSTFGSLFLRVPTCFRAGPAAIILVSASLQTDTSHGKSHKCPKVCQNLGMLSSPETCEIIWI
jgi:hypothetical protein